MPGKNKEVRKERLEELENHYRGQLPNPIPLQNLRPSLTLADERYLEETRDVQGTNEEHLAFYYQHKEIMQRILTEQKIRSPAMKPREPGLPPIFSRDLNVPTNWLHLSSSWCVTIWIPCG